MAPRHGADLACGGCVVTGAWWSSVDSHFVEVGFTVHGKRYTTDGIRINDLVIRYTQAFSLSFLRAGCGGIRTACAATSQLARTRVSVSVSHRRESVACRDSARGLAAEQFDANSEVATRPRGPRGSFGDARAHTSCVRTQPHKAGHRTRCSFPLDRLGGFDAFTTGSLSK
jgi:hypothetical protein